MGAPDFSEQYARMANDELLFIASDRTALLPEALLALDLEMQKRGLRNRDAGVVKRRVQRLTARERDGHSLMTLSNNERSTTGRERKVTRFVGDEEPEYVSQYRGRAGVFGIIDYENYKLRTWQVFRERTGRWPLFSICFHILALLTLVTGIIAFFVVRDQRAWGTGWSIFVGIAFVIAYGVCRAVGSIYMRKLDWMLFKPKG